MTQQMTRNVGHGPTASVEKAHGFKLQDAVLLNDCISTAAICISCRKRG